MILKEIPARAEWMPGLKKVEQDIPATFIGSVHYCSFENFQAIVSPLRMVPSDEGIMFAESCLIKELNLSLVYEYVFKKKNEKNCSFGCRFMNTGETPIPEQQKAIFFQQLQNMAARLKEQCEKTNPATA